MKDIKVSNSSFWQGSRKGVFDTFYSYFTLPAKEYNFFREFVKLYQNDIICDTNKPNCKYPGACKGRYAKLPDLKIQFGDNHTFSVVPQDYLEDITEGGKQYCDIKVHKSPDDYYNIG